MFVAPRKQMFARNYCLLFAPFAETSILGGIKGGAKLIALVTNTPFIPEL